MDNKVIHKYIAVTIAVGIFLFFSFGTIFFPLSNTFFSTFFSDDTPTLNPLPLNTEDGDTAGIGILPEQRLDGALIIIDLQQGDGEPVSQGDIVRVGYIGTFSDTETGEEVEFDKNTDPASGLTFTLGDGQLIAGFDAAVEGMRPGGVRIAVIQPEAGYGDRRVGSIPPNTTLQFVIELYEAR